MLADLITQIQAIAAGLPTWAWFGFMGLFVVGLVWLMVDVVSFLCFTFAGVVLTVLVAVYAYPYVSHVFSKFTQATSTVVQAAVAPPVKAMEALPPGAAPKKPKHTN